MLHRCGRRIGLIAAVVLLLTTVSPASAEPPVPPTASPRPPVTAPVGPLPTPKDVPSRLRFGTARAAQANFSGTVTIPKTTTHLTGPTLKPQRVATSSPIAGARVVFPDHGLLATTDASGRFEVNIPIAGPREFVTYAVESSGFGTWTRIGERLEPGQSYHVEVFLERTAVTSEWQPPLSEVPGALIDARLNAAG